MIETISNNINEMPLGFDGPPAPSSDGSAGRPIITLKPVVTILDNSTILVEATLPSTYSYDESLKEVYIQMKDSSGFTPIARHVFAPIIKTTSNEVKIQVLIEVK